MLIKELIVRHLGTQGAVHERDLRLDDTQVPSGITVHRKGDDGAGEVTAGAGDLVLVSAPVGLGLPEHIDADLPVGATMLLLLEVELTELPVDRVLAALAVAKLQVVEAVVVSGVPVATVAVVATRTDELIVPAPTLAHDLEPGDHTGPEVLRRVLGEHTLEGLVRGARERVLQAQVAAVEARLGEVTGELEKFRVDRAVYEAALVRNVDAARKETAAARRETTVARRETTAARKEADAERKRMLSLRSSTSFRLASRLARASGVARRIIPRSGQGKV